MREGSPGSQSSDSQESTRPGSVISYLSVADRTLKGCPSREHFDLHLAAQEWSLATPIVIRSLADAKSLSNWRDKVEPFHHQVQNFLTFFRRAPVALFADDVGLGKTISAGMVMSEVMTAGNVERCLVICPSLLLPQWKEELAEKFGIQSEYATGSSLRTVLRSQTPVVITTYQSARSYIDDIREAGFSMVVLDEAHKLRNLCGTNKPPQIAEVLHGALKEKMFTWVLMLTATPIQNRLWDLYSLVELLAAAKGHHNPLGDEAQFAARYIADSASVAAKLNPSVRDEFRRHLSNYIVRTQRSDSRLQFPTREVKILLCTSRGIESQLTEVIQRLFVKEKVNSLVQSSIAVALMSSPQALQSQLRNMANKGTIPKIYADQVEKLVTPGMPTGKMDVLLRLIDDLRSRKPDWRLVVFTTRTETQRAIGEALQARQIPFGFISGASRIANQKSVESFRSTPPLINVIVSTDSGAEGVNLQAGNVLVNYDLPWNPMIVEQRIGRIQRLGSKHDSVSVLNLAIAGSVEETIVARLLAKLQVISQCLGDIESILESADLGGDDESGGIESLIGNMVVRSLKGQNVDEAKRKMDQSIEEGKALYEKERKTVESTLGQMDAMHRTGPSMPDIRPFTPSTTPEDFVRRALSASGATLRDLDHGVIEVRFPNRTSERITFNERARRLDDSRNEPVFAANKPKLYRPGQPAFERLAQQWIDGHSALIYDLSEPDSDRQLVQAVAENWLSTFDGASLKSVSAKPSDPVFQGEVICKASAAVSHDRLEKLVSVKVTGEDGEIPVPEGLDKCPIVRGDFRLAELADDIEDFAHDAVTSDGDVMKFTTFYHLRREEELRLAKGDPAASTQISQRLTPSVSAEAVAVRGVRYHIYDVSVTYSIDDQGAYNSTIRWNPATQQSELPVASAVCEITGRRLPPECTDRCVFSNKLVMGHLLHTSASSGRRALPQHLVTCEQSGARLLPDEVDKCAVSGKVVDRRLLAESAVSGVLALPELMVASANSGARCLPSEAVTCEVSGKRLLPSETRTCAISGKQVDSGLTDTSALSGRVALREYVKKSILSGRAAIQDELVTCSESGALLVTDEVANCAVSGKAVDRRLLVPSEDSQRLALPAHRVRCEATQKLVLADEVGTCAFSGKTVLKRLLEPCVLTGRLGLRSTLTECAASGKYFSTDRQADQAAAKATPFRQASVDCTWLAERVCALEASRCRLCGLVFAKMHLNGDGEFTILRDLLDGRSTTAASTPMDARLVIWLRGNQPALAKFTPDRQVVNPANNRVVFAGKSTAGLFGFGARYAGGLLATLPAVGIEGPVLIGVRKGSHWEPQI